MDLAAVDGTVTTEPVPAWASLQRELMSLMDDAVPELVRKFAERGGALYFAEDYDDLYEVCATWSLYYALGGRFKPYLLPVTVVACTLTQPAVGMLHCRWL